MQWIIRTIVLLLVCIVLLVLFGCAPVKPAPPVVPKVVTQTVTKYVQVPAELTEPCPVEEPLSRTVAEAVRVARARKDALSRTVAEAVRVARARKDALVMCNKQLEAIRSIGK